jgi:hypothetical protein
MSSVCLRVEQPQHRVNVDQVSAEAVYVGFIGCDLTGDFGSLAAECVDGDGLLVRERNVLLQPPF